MKELLEKIIFYALQYNATDIHFYFQTDVSIRFRIFGELVDYTKIDEEGDKLMNYIKYQASINTNYKLLAQTGQFHIDMDKKRYELRVSYLPTHDFESIVIRILNNHKTVALQELTMLSDIQFFLEQLIHKEHGLFLVSGATGSGKSTTLYAIMDEIIKDKRKNIISIEDPIEIHKQGCIQVELNEKLGVTYHQTLHQILRHDPDVIVIGEIRDSDTAKIAITCALTGHLVLTTIHASNALMALKRLINLGVSSIDLEDVAIGSMSQRLKYDKINQKVIVLAELIDRKQIKEYLRYNTLNYESFDKQKDKLVTLGINRNLFTGDNLE